MRIFAALLTRITSSGKLFQGRYLGKTKSTIRNLTPYGFFSFPPKNSKMVVMQDGFEGFYAIAYKDDIIPSLKEGEVVIGNYVKGTVVKFDESGNMDITCVGNETVNVSGNCTINVTGDATVTAENISVTANTSASVTAPTSSVTSSTSATITSPSTSILSGGVGSVLVTATGTTIDGKLFLTHVHPAGTPPANTGIVV